MRATRSHKMHKKQKVRKQMQICDSMFLQSSNQRYLLIVGMRGGGDPMIIQDFKDSKNNFPQCTIIIQYLKYSQKMISPEILRFHAHQQLFKAHHVFDFLGFT